MCMTRVTYAQIYNSEVLFYYYAENTKGSTAAGSLNRPEAWIFVCRFKNGKLFCPRTQSYQCLTTFSAHKVKENLKRNINYYEIIEWAEVGHGFIGDFDTDMSTSKWTIFKIEQPKIEDDEWNRGNSAYNEYNGFRNDFSEYINWCEPDVHDRGRYIYKKCTKQEIMNTTYSGKRDFLD